MPEELLQIVIDNREQAPWGFPGHLAKVSWGTLNAGDYALAGDKRFAIERKSLDDFLGTISTGWDRFCREIDRMDAADFPAKVVIVEGNFEACCFRQDAATGGGLLPPDHRHFNLTPQFVTRRIAELTMRGVSVLFAGNASYAAAVALKILLVRHEDLENEQQD